MKQTVVYTVVATEFTDNTLQLFMIKNPRRTVTIHIALKRRIRSPPEGIKKFTPTIVHVNGHPVTPRFASGICVAHQQARRGWQGVDESYRINITYF